MKTRIIKTMLLVIVFAIGATSCEKNHEPKEPIPVLIKPPYSFKEQDVQSVFKGSDIIYLFDVKQEQITYSPDGSFYFIGNTDQTRYINFEMESLGENRYKVIITSEGIDALPNGEFKMKEVKDDNATKWFWDWEKGIGVVLKY